MNKESLKKILLARIERLIQDLNKAINSNSFDEITYREGQLNECLDIYQRILYFEIPDSMWGSIIRVWHLVEERAKEEKQKGKSETTQP